MGRYVGVGRYSLVVASCGQVVALGWDDVLSLKPPLVTAFTASENFLSVPGKFLSAPPIISF